MTIQLVPCMELSLTSGRYSTTLYRDQPRSVVPSGAEGTKNMLTTQSVKDHLPVLRRYARALTGSQESGDNYVAAALEALTATDTD